jgi:hypothetical protein
MKNKSIRSSEDYYNLFATNGSAPEAAKKTSKNEGQVLP